MPLASTVRCWILTYLASHVLFSPSDNITMTTDDLRKQCDETDRLTAALRERNNPYQWMLEWALAQEAHTQPAGIDRSPLLSQEAHTPP